MAPAPIDDMVGGGPFHLAAGEWTDDTSMALCLAESLKAYKGFNGLDVMNRFLLWWRQGYMSVLGYCFDIGNATKAALQRFEKTGVYFAGNPDPEVAGNGSLMRLAPIPILFWKDLTKTKENAIAQSLLTHAAPVCLECCQTYAMLIHRALHGQSKQDILSGVHVPSRREDVEPSGYVLESMHAALYCFANTDTFRDGCLMAANFGGDADTIAAIYGQLAGAYYGESGIPSEWLNRLSWSEEIRKTAIKLAEIGEEL
jgi:ADP-ribosyl-[dinitrogen reductase] hydrolase